MDDTNPFDAPTTQPEVKRTNRGTLKIIVWSITGGLIGVVLGLFGVVALFFDVDGAPGMMEISLQLIRIAIFLVLPGMVIGAVYGVFVNRKS